ncbi:protein of unknown function DUF3883 [Rhizobium sp. CF080]|uniref:protein NO VEIN domain-containing protein n=1 Tax=Rhizobium sp. (strain CF080) TaxID=1144310 RepID=UPI0002715FAD|nr:DUF3883 domain-containing protein [Rhizobium sp. CF080]EUB95155.1 protein of unknown function DUF3883 [Rhizobium sp. CF080]
MKILWVKFGWSEYYRGGLIGGNFRWLKENRGKDNKAPGHEAFNFKPSPDGVYYCYVPPQAGDHAPSNADNEGWTVICLAKNPKYNGVHIVGWYENATLWGGWYKPPKSFFAEAPETGSAYDWTYCITSKSAFFIPPEERTNPFSHPSVRMGKYSFLDGPGVAATANKNQVLEMIEERRNSLKNIAVHNPSDANAPNPELDEGDPLTGFGTAEHRRAVEMAAEEAIKRYYEDKGFSHERVAHLNMGFDILFRKGRTVHCVEVKGTSASVERFFLTRNENNARADENWRLGIVTHALSKNPKVTVYDDKALKSAFDLEPYVFIGSRVFEPIKL